MIRVNNDKSILIVDDDEDHLFMVGRYAASYGLQHKAAKNGVEAIEYLRTENFSIVVTDLLMPGIDGMELLGLIKKQLPHIDVIVMTGYSNQYSYVDVIGAGASDFIEKPFKREEFSAKLDRVLRERRNLEELRKAKEKAEAGSKAKSDFISTISHELKTPMNGIIGFTGLLKEEKDLPDHVKEYVRLISGSADMLMNLIEELLEFSHVNGRKQDIVPTPFNLKKLFDAIFCSLTPKATEKSLSLALAVDDSLLHKNLYCDAGVIAKIINHLVDNAIKISEQGEINIGVEIKERLEDSRLMVLFTVQDQGCGIEPEKQRSIFEPFTQVEDFMTRRHEGVGLGLAICARLVKLLHGDIWVESEPGKGSVFYFTGLMDMAGPITNGLQVLEEERQDEENSNCR